MLVEITEGVFINPNFVAGVYHDDICSNTKVVMCATDVTNTKLCRFWDKEISTKEIVSKLNGEK